MPGQGANGPGRPSGDTGEGPGWLDPLRDLAGVEQPVSGWNSVASADAIRHFAHGYGDSNPLWCAPDYAARSVRGQITAPPTFLYSCSSTGRQPGHPGPAQVLTGSSAIWLEDAWCFGRPVRVDEAVSASVVVQDVSIRTSASRGPCAIVTEQYRFRIGAETVATCIKKTMRFRRQDTTARSAHVPEPHYTLAELGRLGERFAAEDVQRRGSAARRIGDVTAADSLGQILKGPLSQTSLAAWISGTGSPHLLSDRLAHAIWQADPHARLVSPLTGRPEMDEAAHWDPEYAAVAGMSRGYDFGSQRIAWLGHLVTDWAGDAGQVSALSGRLLAPNLIGDLTTVSGSVTRVDARDVTCEIAARNQRGELTASGVATVVLPGG